MRTLGSPRARQAWMAKTPSFLPKSFALPLPVSSVNLCSLLLPLVLFASKKWIYLAITRYAARSQVTELRGTTMCGTSCSNSLISASSRPRWRSRDDDGTCRSDQGEEEEEEG